MKDYTPEGRITALEKRVAELEARLEEVAQHAANAARLAESADMWHRPIGGSDYSVDMTDPTR